MESLEHERPFGRNLIITNMAGKKERGPLVALPGWEKYTQGRHDLAWPGWSSSGELTVLRRDTRRETPRRDTRRDPVDCNGSGEMLKKNITKGIPSKTATSRKRHLGTYL